MPSFSAYCDFLARLAHAGEHAPARVASGLHDPEQLAAADDVEPGPGAGHGAQDSEVAVGFHREANQMIDAAKRPVQFRVPLRDVSLAVDVERRAEFTRQPLQRYLLAMQRACFVIE